MIRKVHDRVRSPPNELSQRRQFQPACPFRLPSCAFSSPPSRFRLAKHPDARNYGVPRTLKHPDARSHCAGVVLSIWMPRFGPSALNREPLDAQMPLCEGTTRHLKGRLLPERRSRDHLDAQMTLCDDTCELWEIGKPAIHGQTQPR
jgi:hypothetical protein